MIETRLKKQKQEVNKSKIVRSKIQSPFLISFCLVILAVTMLWEWLVTPRPLQKIMTDCNIQNKGSRRQTNYHHELADWAWPGPATAPQTANQVRSLPISNNVGLEKIFHCCNFTLEMIVKIIKQCRRHIFFAILASAIVNHLISTQQHGIRAH